MALHPPIARQRPPSHDVTLRRGVAIHERSVPLESLFSLHLRPSSELRCLEPTAWLRDRVCATLLAQPPLLSRHPPGTPGVPGSLRMPRVGEGRPAHLSATVIRLLADSMAAGE